MKYFVYSFVAAALLLTGCATSVMTSGRVVIEDNDTQDVIGFSNRDREQIRNYYTRPENRRQSGGLSPGLAKRDALPNGVRSRSLPAVLESRLSRLPEGYKRVVVGTNIVIINRRTRVIVDLVRDIYPN